MKPFVCALVVGLVFVSSTFADQRFTIITDPPGAMVFVNGTQIGQSPATVPFTYYGTYQILLVKDGLETQTIKQKVESPFNGNPLIELLAENVCPFEIRDNRTFRYTMQINPQKPVKCLGQGTTMRRTWGIFALALAVTKIAFHDKPKPQMRQPLVQNYSLPDESIEMFNKPPEYPKEDSSIAKTPPAKNSDHAELMKILNETESPDTFLVTLGIILELEPNCDGLLPTVIRRADKLGLMKGLASGNATTEQKVLADAMEKIVAARKSQKAIAANSSVLGVGSALIGGAIGNSSDAKPTSPAQSKKRNESIKTIFIPVFENKTFQTIPYRAIEFELTRAVMREVELKGYKVVSNANDADTELLGTLVTINKNITNRAQQNEVRQGDLILGVQLVWRDLRTGVVLSKPPKELGVPKAEDLPPFDPDNLPEPENLEKAKPVMITCACRYLPEVGETNATAQTRVCNKLAKQIADFMTTRSATGNLRRANFPIDGKQAYALENANGDVLYYLTAADNVKLDKHVNGPVTLTGTKQLRGDIRGAEYMTVIGVKKDAAALLREQIAKAKEGCKLFDEAPLGMTQKPVVNAQARDWDKAEQYEHNGKYAMAEKLYTKCYQEMRQKNADPEQLLICYNRIIKCQDRTTPVAKSTSEANANFLRAQQSELASLIMEMETIASARVTINRAESNPFVREQMHTTASVVLMLKPETALNRSTAEKIISLVSRCVDGLKPENVSIIDRNGRILTGPSSK